MTFGQVIEWVQEARPSDFSEFLLAQWLTDYDARLLLEYVVPYSDDDALEAVYGYRGVENGIAWIRDTIAMEDTTTQDWAELMAMEFAAVQPPYDGLYFDYLVMMVDLRNSDYDRYNNDALLLAANEKEWRNRIARYNVHRLNRNDPANGTPVRLAF